jgi:phytanoyl-CoA dioxygenase PhyH
MARALGDRRAKATQNVSRQLTGPQQRALASLAKTGIAIASFDELIEDEPLWQELRTDMDAFVASAEATFAERGKGGKKKFLIRRYERGKSKLPLKPALLPTDGPWLRYAAGDTLLDIVNAYRGVMTKLVDFDQWYTLPVGEDDQRVASQQWHRDPEDQHVVKVFLYFSDVDDEAGPLEYIPESAEGSRYGDLWPWGKESPRYPPTEELEQAIPASDRIALTGPTGTLVICDTSGFHRGGYARSKPRILSTQTYVNKKITADRPERRRFQVDWRDQDLSEQARFALT